MNKWLKIKRKIYEEKLSRIEKALNEVEETVKNNSKPRDEWASPLDEWASQQIQDKSSLRLSLQEYAYLKELSENLSRSFFTRSKKENIVEEFKNKFKDDYLEILDSKENNLKLEISAELIEESQFPLELFSEWYAQNLHLSPEKFEEAVGNFWGDVWKHAGKGAGLGALGGAAVGGIPTGGLGTFAGAGLGGLTGGLAGGAYGAGKNLLQRVWQYRQTQRNFDQTKQKALESLNKLKDLSRGFDLNPNFLKSLDTLINQLGNIKAYKIASGGSGATPEPEAPEGMDGTKAAPPIVAEPKVGDMGTPKPMPEVPPEMPKPTEPVAAEVPPTPEVPPEVATAAGLPPEKVKKPASPAQLAAIKKAQEALAARRAAKLAAKAAETPAAPEATPPVEEPPAIPKTSAAPKFPVRVTEDIFKYYQDAKDNDEKMAHLGQALYAIIGATKPEVAKKRIERGDLDSYDSVDMDNNFKHDWNNEHAHESDEERKQEHDKAIDLARFFAKWYEAKHIDHSVGSSGTPTPMPPSEGTPVAPKASEPDKQYSEEELRGMKKRELFKIAKSLGLPETELDPKINDAEDYVNTILNYYANPHFYKKESAMQKYGKMIHEQKLATLPYNEKVAYLKSLMRC